MLYLPPGTGLPQRARRVRRRPRGAQGGRVPEVAREAGLCRRCWNLQNKKNAVDGVPSGEKDPLYDQAVEIVLRTRRPSISLVQRHLRIGYNRAARLIEDMERAGMVSPMQSNGNREVLVPAKAE